MKTIRVDTRSFARLFEGATSLHIPEYQRPYTWTTKAAAALLNDVQLAFTGTAAENDYYLGSVVFYKNAAEDTYEIIDGQQRITTLLIIQYLLQGELPTGLNISLATEQSAENIVAVRNYLAEHLAELNSPVLANLLGRLRFTRIITTTEDAAFTFFDTQNNRGVTLGVSDYLKAYHLREIHADGSAQGSEALQAAYAQMWENTDVSHSGGTFLAPLFEQVLWRARHWKGQRNLDFESQARVLQTFQTDTLSPISGQHSTSSLNRWALPAECPVASEASTDAQVDGLLPYSLMAYSLRQPLFKGSHFFEYTRKYAQCFDLLFGSQPAGLTIQLLRDFWLTVYSADMSVYLRQFMQLCLLVYYDSFGQLHLVQAAYCFDYWIGVVRLEKRQVRKESVLLPLEQHQRNLLDVITQAYSPQEIFDFVYELDSLRDVYTQQAKVTEEQLWPVQRRYRIRLLEHFERPHSELTNRATWNK